MSFIAPGDLFQIQNESNDHFLIVVLGDTPRHSTLLKFDKHHYICFILYDSHDIHGQDDELMYHGHTVETRLRLLKDLAELRDSFLVNYEKPQEHQHAIDSVLYPINYTSVLHGEDREMNYIPVTLHPAPISVKHNFAKKIENVQEFTNLINHLRTQRKISNRHHRKLKEFFPFLPTSFLSSAGPLLSL